MTIELSAVGANLLPDKTWPDHDLHCPKFPGADLNYWKASCQERQRFGCKCKDSQKSHPIDTGVCECGRPVSPGWKRSFLRRPACKVCIEKDRLRRQQARKRITTLTCRRDRLRAKIADLEKLLAKTERTLASLKEVLGNG